MSDYVCEMCSEEGRFVFTSLDGFVSPACAEHREPVVERAVQLALERTHLVSGVKRAEVTHLRVEDDPANMTVLTFEQPRDVPPAGSGSERELTPDEHIALLKERNAKAREAINGLVAENEQLRAELGRRTMTS